MIVKGSPDQWYFYHLDGLGSAIALSNYLAALYRDSSVISVLAVLS